MQKKFFLVLLLVVCIALSGCALVVKDPVRDAQQVIIDIEGETVDKQTMTKLVDDEYNYMYSLYSMYGLDPSRYLNRDTIQDEVINRKVEEIVLKKQFAKNGLTLTAEDETEIAAHAKEEFDQMIESIKTNFLSDSKNEGDALTEEAIEYAKNLDPTYTLEEYTNHARQEKMVELLRSDAIKDVTVSDEEINNEYQTRLTDAKSRYEADLSAYGTDVNNNTTVYYNPAGYRYVKQILIGLDDETKSAITTANNAVTTAQTALDNANKALSDNQTAQEAEGVTEEEKAELVAKQAELKTEADKAQADLDEKKAAADKALADAFAALQPKLDEVSQKITEGVDFDQLITDYNTDPGMQREPGKTKGYAICANMTGFDEKFVNAGMALEKIGDISEPVRSDNFGYFIIRYQSDIQEGDVQLDDVRETIKEELLSQKQDTTYDEAVKKWIDAAGVKKYIERLAN